MTPGLLRPPPNGAEPATRWPAIETLLARGRRRRLPAPGLAGAVHWLSNGGLRPDRTWPVAPISLLGEGLAPAADWWLRADPVHLLPDADRLRLMPAESLGLEARDGLVKVFNEHFAAEGYHLAAPHSQRWYLRAPRPLRIGTHTPEEAADHYVYDFMPAGPDAGLAARLMTEAQMLFHAAAEWRTPASEPAVNSLWLWGGGELPQQRRVPLPFLWSNEPFARGLWLLTGNSVGSLPATAANCLAQQEPEGFAMLQSLDAPGRGRHPALETLERDWCAPLIDAIERGELDRLTLLPGGAEGFELTRAAARRFWRRRKPLAAIPVRHA